MEPASPKEFAQALADTAASGKPIEIGGHFTKTRWGGPIASGSVRISTARLNRVLEYEPRDLTISVEAGMPYAELTALLAKNDQMIPLDPPYADHATIGGVLAANHSGPRRRLYGTGRDLVIGMQFATLEGQLIQSGGMVVKNVAGLDMAKMMIGSYGTLAGIATVNFKLIPRDKFTRTFLLSFASAAEAIRERKRILGSVLQPTAIDLLNPAASQQLHERQGWLLAIGTGGNQALLDRYQRELGSATVLEGAQETAFWKDVHNFACTFLEVHTKGAVVRASTTLNDMQSVLEAHHGPAIARAANGVTYLYHAEAPKSVPDPTGAWPNEQTWLMEAGPANRQNLTMWPKPGNDLAVMQSVKQMLDPKNLLNQGRLYGRI